MGIKTKALEAMFPESLVSGSVVSQRGLIEVFKQYPEFSRTYVQTAVHSIKTREWYEGNWSKVQKYLDNNFLDRFKLEAEHHARAWEFHLAAVLFEKGLLLQEKTWKYGPDFCINLSDGKKLWIEAIACDLGTVDPVEPYPDMKPGAIYSFGGNIEDIHRPRALRITSAIDTKLKKFRKYLGDSQKSGVQFGDCLLIAVNGSAIQHHDEPNMLFKYSVFGQGPDVLIKVPGMEKLQGGFYKPVEKITKKSGDKEHSIPTNFMEMENFSIISAVLYCGHTASHSWLNGFKVGDDFLFAYHTNPQNPILDGTFKFGRGINKNLKTGIISDREQK